MHMQPQVTTATTHRAARHSLRPALEGTAMIVVTATLISATDGSTRELGRIEICNDGTGTNDVGNYTAKLFAEYCDGRTGHVKGFRRRKQSVWTLIGRFLKQWNHK